MKKRILTGAAALILAFTGFTGINQASADDGATPSLTVRAVSTAQGDSSAYLAARCPEHTAKTVTRVGEWKIETIDLKGQSSEFGYMITSIQGQIPTSLTCFSYQDQFINTTITVDLIEVIDPWITVTDDDVARKATPGGNIMVGVTGFTTDQELDVTLCSKPYPLGKTIVAANGSAQLNAVLSGDATPGSSRYVVVKNDNEIGLANVTVVNRDNLKKSGQPGSNDGRKNKSGLPRTGVVI